MTYSIVKEPGGGESYAVIDDETGEPHGTAMTLEEAERMIGALRGGSGGPGPRKTRRDALNVPFGVGGDP